MTQHRTLSDKIWRDKNGDVAIAQKPNAPIIVWVLLRLIAFVVKHGTVHSAALLLSSIVLVYWASLELFHGVNYFRRGLGLVVLLVSIISIIKGI